LMHYRLHTAAPCLRPRTRQCYAQLQQLLQHTPRLAQHSQHATH
jgi:hypothetical protein